MPPPEDHRLSLAKPQLVDIDLFESHGRRLAARNNQMLIDVFEGTTTELPKLIATVRWSLLQQFREPFAKAVGIGNATVADMEGDRPADSRFHRETYTKLLHHLETCPTIHADVREQLLDLLVPGDTCNDFYERVGFEVGFPQMLSTAGLSDAGFWQRHKSETIPDLREVQSMVAKAYPGKSAAMKQKREFRQQQGESVWIANKLSDYGRRQLEAPFASFLTALERFFALQNQTLSVESICTAFGCTQALAGSVLRCRLPAWDEIADIAAEIMPDQVHDLPNSWRQAESADRLRPTFESRFVEQRDASELSNGELATWLNIRPPEERRQEFETQRGEGYRPSAEIRRVLREGGYFGQVQMRAISTLVSSSPTEFNELRRQFREDRIRDYRRNGARVFDGALSLRIAREWNSVTFDEMAAELCPEEDDAAASMVRRIATLELGTTQPEEGELRSLIAAAERLGHEKAAAALARKEQDQSNLIPAECRQSRGVTDLLENLHSWLGSFKSLSEQLRDRAEDRSQQISEVRMRKIARSEKLCPLPTLKLLYKTMAEAELPANIVEDWYAARAALLATGDESRSDPLARLLDTIIHSRENSIRQFFANRIEGQSEDLGWSWVHFPNSRHQYPSWEGVQMILLAADYSSRDTPWKLARSLFDHESDVSAAVSDMQTLLQRRPNQYKCSELPGLTREELGIEEEEEAKADAD